MTTADHGVPVGVASPTPARLPTEIRLLVTLGALVAVGYGIAAPALPTLARSLDAGIAGASVLVGAFGAVRVAAAPLGGRLVRRLGERRVFCGGLLVVALSSAACAVAAGFPQLLVFRAAGGVGSAMFTVSAAALLVRLAPHRMRGRASAAWSGGFLLGTVARSLTRWWATPGRSPGRWWRGSSSNGPGTPPGSPRRR